LKTDVSTALFAGFRFGQVYGWIVAVDMSGFVLQPRLEVSGLRLKMVMSPASIERNDSRAGPILTRSILLRRDPESSYS
jgi:hypothetical protein